MAWVTLCALGNAIAAVAPPRSLEAVVKESDVIAVLKIEKVEKSKREIPLGGVNLPGFVATATVQKAIKGRAVGEKLRIEFITNLAEVAVYKEGEECLAFLMAKGDHYETPLSMFGKYVVKDGRVMQWIIGRERVKNEPLKTVIAEIEKAQK